MAKEMSATSRDGPWMRRLTSRHCTGVRRKSPVSRDRRRYRRVFPKAMLAPSLPVRQYAMLKGVPTATEIPRMLLAAAVKRHTKGSILRAGNGTRGDCEGEALSSRRAEAVVPAIEGADLVRSCRPFIVGALKTLQAADLGELGVDVPLFGAPMP